MNTKVNKAYFLIPALYTAAIIFMLYLQFSGSSTFSAEASGIRITGKTQASAPGKDKLITELKVLCNGLYFTFDKENPLTIYARDGLTHKTEPVDYRVTSSEVGVFLTKGIEVSFYSAREGEDNINISVDSGDPESIRYISIPLITQEDTQLSAVEGVPVLSVSSESGHNFFLTLPEGAIFNRENSSLEIYPGQDGFEDIVFERAADSSLDAFIFWLSGNSELVSDEDLDSMLLEYLEKSINALESDRFNRNSGTWESYDGRPVFSEEALITLASEKIGDSDYPEIKTVLDRIAERHSSDIGIFGSTMFGNIVNTGQQYEAMLVEKLEDLTGRSQDMDYSVFSDPYLSTVVLTENSENLLGNLIRMSLDLPAGEIFNIKTAAGMLGFYSEISSQLPERISQFSSLLSVTESSIMPSIKVIADNLFLVDEKGTSDIYLSLKTGLLLRSMPVQEEGKNSAALGRELINSALSLSDENGFLPGTVSEGPEGRLLTEGGLAPEKIYPLLSDNTYYPSEDYFLFESGERFSVINQADNFDIEKTGNGYKFVFDFPAGQIHTFAVRNIKPFAQMNLLGYVWNADSRFLQYFSGWWYDRATETLYIKIRHRAETEEIFIYTERPQSAP